LDNTLLAELLGQAELRELLDLASLLEVEREIQRLPPDRHPRDLDGAADLFRLVGDLRADEAAARGVSPGWLDSLADARRTLPVRIAGEDRFVAIEDAGRLRDALGVALPVGVPEVFTEPVADPVGDLISRYARTHGPFQVEDCARRLGLGVAVVTSTLSRLSVSGRVTSGEFRPAGAGLEWCDADVLRLIRRRSLAALRKEIEPVEPATFGRFLPIWQGVGPRLSGVDGVLTVVEQLAGALVPASALETLVLPARIRDYHPAMLDELTSAGEVLWTGAGGLPGSDGWLTLTPADLAPLLLPDPVPNDSDLALAVLSALEDGRALFFRDLVTAIGSLDDAEVETAIWDLVWAGLLTNDTLAPLRTTLAGRGAHRQVTRAKPRYGRAARPGRARMPSRSGPPQVGGRWSAVPARDADPTRRVHARAESLVERHGVLTRSASGVDEMQGAFATLYPVLRAMEESGRLRRGYFIESLGAAQFGSIGAVDRLRGIAGPTDNKGTGAVLLAAADPANPYGAALPWPAREGGHRPGRKAGGLVVLVAGALALYVERGGRSLLTFTEDPDVLAAAAAALANGAGRGALGRLTVQRSDGAPAVEDSPMTRALEAAGFSVTPRGLRLRPSR
ncbi:MAG: DEAD/DEAH box helicase, partial [Actinomycetota bacterium]|nr:DEAD/DEAH box helicase [Actinomycetota bacterium]